MFLFHKFIKRRFCPSSPLRLLLTCIHYKVFKRNEEGRKPANDNDDDDDVPVESGPIHGPGAL